MKRGMMRSLGAALLIFLLSLATAAAKGPVDRITVEGPGLEEPVALTGPAHLDGFNPWQAGFIDWFRGALDEAPEVGKPYTARFYLRTSNGNFQERYLIRYYPAGEAGEGYIHLPGPDEEGYRTNIGTIVRDADDGAWFYATPDWEESLQPLLPRSRTSLLTARAASLRSSLTGEAGFLLALLLLASFAAWIAQQRRQAMLRG